MTKCCNNIYIYNAIFQHYTNANASCHLVENQVFYCPVLTAELIMKFSLYSSGLFSTEIPLEWAQIAINIFQKPDLKIQCQRLRKLSFAILIPITFQDKLPVFLIADLPGER